VAEQYGYAVEFRPVGPDDPEVGPPTQMAVFTQATKNDRNDADDQSDGNSQSVENDRNDKNSQSGHSDQHHRGNDRNTRTVAKEDTA
jgi:hypothetical protein